MPRAGEGSVAFGLGEKKMSEAYVYVLPYGVDKGTTLGRYVVEQNLAPNAVLAIAEQVASRKESK